MMTRRSSIIAAAWAGRIRPTVKAISSRPRRATTSGNISAVGFASPAWKARNPDRSIVGEELCGGCERHLVTGIGHCPSERHERVEVAHEAVARESARMVSPPASSCLSANLTCTDRERCSPHETHESRPLRCTQRSLSRSFRSNHDVDGTFTPWHFASECSDRGLGVVQAERVRP